MLKRNKTAVLELGTGKLTVLTCSIEKDGRYVVTGKGKVPYGGYYGESFLDDTVEVGNCIKRAIKDAESISGEKIKELVVGVPTAFCAHLVRSINYKFGGKKKIGFEEIKKISDMASVVEGSERFTLIESAAVSYRIDDEENTDKCIGKTCSEIRGKFSLIYMNNKFKAFMERALKNAGVKKFCFISECAAESRFVFDELSVIKTPILVDVGMSGTQVCVKTGRGFSVMGYISVGGAHISSDLSEVLGLEFDSAERLKEKINLNLHPNNRDVYMAEEFAVPVDRCNGIVQARLEDFVSGIMKELEKADSYEDDTKMYLSGGGFCYVKGADAYISKLLGLDVISVEEIMSMAVRVEEVGALGLVKEAVRMVLRESEGIYRFE